ncbi:MAG: hypothetical protein AAGG02_14650, partial [Cyanobacteria bacterium P01_H01_bin.15]
MKVSSASSKLLSLILGVGFSVIANAVFPTVVSAGPSLTQAGKQSYEAGRYAQAAEYLEAAGEPFGNQVSEEAALIWGNLSLVYQKLGRWPDAETAIAKGQAQLPRGSSLAQAQLDDIEGQLNWQRGRSQQALTAWNRSAKIYEAAEAELPWIRNRLNAAQVKQSLGLYRQSQRTLQAARERLEAQPDSTLKNEVAWRLGNSLRLIGDFSAAIATFETLLATAAPALIPDIYLALGRTEIAQGETSSALQHYQQGLAVTSLTPEQSRRLQLAQLAALVEQNPAQATQQYQSLTRSLADLAPSRETLYMRLALAEYGLQLEPSNTRELANLVAIAKQEADLLQDPRGQSLALGTLSKIYASTNQTAIALDLAQQALLLAETLEATDLAYRWHWQLGQLYR